MKYTDTMRKIQANFAGLPTLDQVKDFVVASLAPHAIVEPFFRPYLVHGREFHAMLVNRESLLFWDQRGFRLEPISTDR